MTHKPRKVGPAASIHMQISPLAMSPLRNVQGVGVWALTCLAEVPSSLNAACQKLSHQTRIKKLKPQTMDPRSNPRVTPVGTMTGPFQNPYESLIKPDKP